MLIGKNAAGGGSGFNIPTEIKIGGQSNPIPPTKAITTTTRTTKAPSAIGVAPTTKVPSNVLSGSGSNWKILRQEQTEDIDGYHYL